MDITALLQWALDLAKTQPWAGVVMIIVSSLGTLVVLASVVIAITPTKKDDDVLGSIRKSWAGKILDFLERFSVIYRKTE